MERELNAKLYLAIVWKIREFSVAEFKLVGSNQKYLILP